MNEHIFMVLLDIGNWSHLVTSQSMFWLSYIKKTRTVFLNHTITITC